MKNFDVKEFAQAMGIPEKIEIPASEVVLNLSGYAMDEIYYEIHSEYPYSVKGETSNTRVVNFAGGRMIIPGDEIAGLVVLGVSEVYQGSGRFHVVFENPSPVKFGIYRKNRMDN